MSSGPQNHRPDRFRNWWMGLSLMAATFLVYLPALHGGFVWDDDTHISGNAALRTLRGLRDIWFTPGATCQYYPLTFTWFWAAYQLWGLNTLGYHLLNVALHGTGAVLLWRLLRALRVPGAWLAGALFAVHPVCAMSVAWMTELKNTLSGTLALCAAWAYIRAMGLGVYGDKEFQVSSFKFEGGGGAEQAHKPTRLDWRYYLLALGLFQLALWAKTAVSFLPVSLGLLAWWQGRRLNWRTIWPLLPMLGIAVGMGLVTIYVERHSGGASGVPFHVPLLERVLISGRSFWFYLGKLFFPHPLIFFYERWHPDARVWWQYLYPLATALLLAGLWGLQARIGRGLFATMLHFYVSTSLLILLVVLYMTRYTYVSDHWQYFGCMSVLAAAAAGMTKLLRLLGGGRAWVAPAVCGAVLLTLGALTWRQAGTYRNLEVLWNDTLAKNPTAWVAHAGLGNLALQDGRTNEAMIHFEEALAIEPESYEAHNSLGGIFLQTGRIDQAISQYEQASDLQPDTALYHFNLGVALVKKGRLDEGLAQYQTALEIQPDNTTTRNNLATTLLRKGRVAEAIVQFQKLLEIQPDNAIVHGNLGNVLLQSRRVDEAIPHFQKALELQPDNYDNRTALGSAFLSKGRVNEGIAQLQQALAIRPDFAPAQDNLNRVTWLMATHPDASVRNGVKALELAQLLVRLTAGTNPAFLASLAAASAETGRYSDAVATAENALRVASQQGNTPLAAALQQQLDLYRANQPFRSPGVSSAPKPSTTP